MQETQKTEMLNPHSVEISKGQSGKISFSVKSYGESVDVAATKAINVFRKLSEEYVPTP